MYATRPKIFLSIIVLTRSDFAWHSIDLPITCYTTERNVQVCEFSQQVYTTSLKVLSRRMRCVAAPQHNAMQCERTLSQLLSFGKLVTRKSTKPKSAVG